MNTHTRANELPQDVLYGHFTSLSLWNAPDFPVFTHGEGVYIYDQQGSKYFDGTSGFYCSLIGHGRKDLGEVAAAQISKLGFMPTWWGAHDAALDAAALISARAPGEQGRVFFVNSGAEANESAMKLAVQVQQARGFKTRTKFLSRRLAYHGLTLGALSLTAAPVYRTPFEAIISPTGKRIPNTSQDHVNYSGRSASLDQIIETIENEGAETIAAIFVEPIQNGGGALVPQADYLKGLREICDHYGILMVCDEVINGFGRVGSWFASEQYGVVPDMLIFAKGATSGYAPIGGLVAKRGLAEEVHASGAVFAHGGTWGGHPLVTAIAAANVRILENEKVIENVQTQAPFLEEGLRKLMDDYNIVRDVRGKGFQWAMALMKDRKAGVLFTPEETKHLMSEVMPRIFREVGVFLRADNRGGLMMILMPPLVSSRKEVEHFHNILGEILGRMNKYIGSM